MRNLFFVFLLGMGLISMSGCGCDDPTDPSCDNYDPCFFEKQKPDLDFDAYQTFGGANSPSFLTDTIEPGSSVYFESNLEDAISYEWWYGIDTIKTEEGHISINFSYSDSTFLVNNPVPITMVAEYELNRECYPNHTGHDTITKYIHFRTLWQASYFGKWEVYVDGNTTDSYEINILYDLPSDYPWVDDRKLIIANLYNEGEDCFQVESFAFLAHNEFLAHTFFYKNAGCGTRPFPQGTIKMSAKVDASQDILYLEWTERYMNLDTEEMEERPRTLIGYRID